MQKSNEIPERMQKELAEHMFRIAAYTHDLTVETADRTVHGNSAERKATVREAVENLFDTYADAALTSELVIVNVMHLNERTEDQSPHAAVEAVAHASDIVNLCAGLVQTVLGGVGYALLQIEDDRLRTAALASWRDVLSRLHDPSVMAEHVCMSGMHARSTIDAAVLSGDNEHAAVSTVREAVKAAEDMLAKVRRK